MFNVYLNKFKVKTLSILNILLNCILNIKKYLIKSKFKLKSLPTNVLYAFCTVNHK